MSNVQVLTDGDYVTTNGYGYYELTVYDGVGHYHDVTASKDNYYSQTEQVYIDESGTAEQDFYMLLEWVTPNGHYPSSGWDNEGKARDGNTGSSAESEKFMLTDEGWTDWLELTITPYISCSKVRYYALYSSTYITKIDIDVYYSSGWHNIYTGSFANKNWQSRLLGGTYTVSKAKVRFYVKGAWNGGEGITAELFEFQFWDTGE